MPTPTDGRRTYYYDTKVQGLGVMVFPSGTKTFFTRGDANKPEKIKLGRVTDMSIEQAGKRSG